MHLIVSSSDAVFWQIENPSVHLTVSASGAVFWQNRQSANALNRQGAAFLTSSSNPPVHSIIRVQPFWHHRKLVSASDRLSVRCSPLTISETRQCIRSSGCSLSDKIGNPPVHSIIRVQFFWHYRKSVSASDASTLNAARRKPHQTANQHFDQHFIQHLIQHFIQHFSPANIISAKTTSARTKHESDYISFSSIIFFLFFRQSTPFSLYTATNQAKEDYKGLKKKRGL